MPFELAQLLPVGHYARKNLAYLAAIQQGATCIYETDDDNAPNENWVVRSEEVEQCRVVSSAENLWVNVYRYFSAENVWPSEGSDDMKAFAASLCGHFELPKRIKSML